MILVSMFDKVAKTYYKPFTAHNLNDATRQLTLAASQPDSMLRLHPHDYTAYQVGKWNPETGEIAPTAHMAVPFGLPLPMSVPNEAEGGESKNVS